MSHGPSLRLVPEGGGSRPLLLPSRHQREVGVLAFLVHERSVAWNPQEIVYMKQKNKHFCLKTVWNHIFFLFSVHVKAEPASLGAQERVAGCVGRQQGPSPRREPGAVGAVPLGSG